MFFFRSLALAFTLTGLGAFATPSPAPAGTNLSIRLPSDQQLASINLTRNKALEIVSLFKTNKTDDADYFVLCIVGDESPTKEDAWDLIAKVYDETKDLKSCVHYTDKLCTAVAHYKNADALMCGESFQESCDMVKNRLLAIYSMCANENNKVSGRSFTDKELSLNWVALV